MSIWLDISQYFLAFYGPRRSRGQYIRKKERSEYPAILNERKGWSMKTSSCGTQKRTSLARETGPSSLLG